MNKKTALSIFSGVSALILAGSIPALAFGHFGHGHHRHGGDEFALYARADGVTHDQIKAAFQKYNVMAEFQKVREDKKALDICIISNSCSNQVSNYEIDLATLTKDKLAAWQSIFAGASSTTPGVTLKTALDNANASKHAAFKTAFGSMKGSPAVESNQQ